MIEETNPTKVRKKKQVCAYAQTPLEPLPEIIDLDAKVYPITEMVDEAGRVVLPLRGTYETGNNDNQIGLCAIEFEGYRNFKRRTRLVSWNDLVSEDQRESEILEINHRILPLPPIIEKGGHTTIFDHEFVPFTKTNNLLTQNPVDGAFVDDGCGEVKAKHFSPRFHPITSRPDYKYWDEDQYLAIQSLSKGQQSIDTYSLMNPLVFKCDVTNRMASSYIVYINPLNNQCYVWCRRCWEKNADYPWHQIDDPELLEEIGFELGIELIKYKKSETEDRILELVDGWPGINRYQIGKELDMTKDMVKREWRALRRSIWCERRQ